MTEQIPILLSGVLKLQLTFSSSIHSSAKTFIAKNLDRIKVSRNTATSGAVPRLTPELLQAKLREIDRHFMNVAAFHTFT